MKKMSWLLLIIFAVFGGHVACSSSGGDNGPTGPSADELITEGWQAFENGDFQTAYDKFNGARQQDASLVEIYSGLGWSLLRLDNLAQAKTEFNVGTTKTDVPADLYAGGAFVLNALKDYRGSNLQADLAFSREQNWTFSHGTGLNADDLRVLKAQNHFLLTNFALSLSEVKKLNPSFTADVQTTAGLQMLAAEIERLRIQTH